CLSDWSSNVCSSDLQLLCQPPGPGTGHGEELGAEFLLRLLPGGEFSAQAVFRLAKGVGPALPRFHEVGAARRHPLPANDCALLRSDECRVGTQSGES